jgi:hypothetical protein
LNEPPAHDPTLREALADFRQANDLSATERWSRTWTCRIGFVTLRLPNFGWRRDAILAHDLHHLLVGYPCTLCGEMRMSAWEFGAGRMPHWGARLLCVPLVSMGFVRSPRSILMAFLAGRRSRSLHEADDIEQLLDLPLSAARRELATGRSLRGGRHGYGHFASLMLESSLVLALPLGMIAAAIALLA